METYILDGARAVWPKLPLVRSLCEIEFALDAISKELAEGLALERAVGDAYSVPSAETNASGLSTERKPSYRGGHTV